MRRARNLSSYRTRWSVCSKSRITARCSGCTSRAMRSRLAHKVRCQHRRSRGQRMPCMHWELNYWAAGPSNPENLERRRDVMVWLRGKKVEALWSNDEESNVWGWIDGAWQKFQDA